MWRLAAANLSEAMHLGELLLPPSQDQTATPGAKAKEGEGSEGGAPPARQGAAVLWGGAVQGSRAERGGGLAPRGG